MRQPPHCLAVLHLRYEQEAAQLLGLPPSLTQAALLPVAYFLGDDFQPAKRTPTVERTYWNGWGRRRGDSCQQWDHPSGRLEGVHVNVLAASQRGTGARGRDDRLGIRHADDL